MQGRPEAGPLLDLAERAEALGYASVWVGDSLLARPRHEPLTLFAGVAGRAQRVALGTAVLLPALRNPVLLAHQVATLDQVSEGRLILGVGFASDRPNIRAEFAAAGVAFEKRLGRMMEGLRLCKALWTRRPVDWDGRWHVTGGVLAPTPTGRAARRYGSAAICRRAWSELAAGSTAGSPTRPTTRPTPLTGRRSSGCPGRRARPRCSDGSDLSYGVTRRECGASGHKAGCVPGGGRRTAGGGDPATPGLLRRSGRGRRGLADGYAQAGASHLVLRFAGDHERHLEALAKVRTSLGW